MTPTESPVSSMAPRALLSLTLLIIDLLSLGFAVANLHGPVRIVLGLLLGAAIPGWSVVGLLKLNNGPLELGLTVAVSLAFLMLVAQILIAAHAWHLVVLQEVTCMICVPSLVWQLFPPAQVSDHSS